MTTLMRSPTTWHVELDPCGVPSVDAPDTIARSPGESSTTQPAGAMRVSVQRIEPPRSDERLAWGTSDGRTVLFRIDEATCREFTARLEAGQDVTSTVVREQVVAIDLDCPA